MKYSAHEMPVVAQRCYLCDRPAECQFTRYRAARYGIPETTYTITTCARCALRFDLAKV